ncbi:hypothetical protein GGS23DRAFT_598575 [Durotheca rogersii]|uniref:uncharacterized protein n=1 Tax=Durotheca rogersii TaxID=419775 RepID=UPI0022201CA6|nr:uncharacterized protein GGS23DRAFT_598575 [Durotheca rogersii]KAI5861423.1 hypothetical protein GGS23DRAFT_598575 [Durotheca rogersii]
MRDTVALKLIFIIVIVHLLDVEMEIKDSYTEVVRAKYKTDFHVINKFHETPRPFYARIDDALR